MSPTDFPGRGTIVGMTADGESLVGINLTDWVARAAELHQTGNLAAAEAAYRRALRHDAGATDALAGLSTLLNQQGRYSEALPLLRAALKQNPDQPNPDQQCPEPRLALRSAPPKAFE